MVDLVENDLPFFILRHLALIRRDCPHKVAWLLGMRNQFLLVGPSELKLLEFPLEICLVPVVLRAVIRHTH